MDGPISTMIFIRSFLGMCHCVLVGKLFGILQFSCIAKKLIKGLARNMNWTLVSMNVLRMVRLSLRCGSEMPMKLASIAELPFLYMVIGHLLTSQACSKHRNHAFGPDYTS